MKIEDTLKEFQAELIRLIQEREGLDRRISTLAQVVNGMKAFIEQTKKKDYTLSAPPAPPPDLVPAASGFTDRVRAVLRSNKDKYWIPTEIRDVLVSSGIENTKQLLIQVHNTVDRLDKHAEIEPE